MLYIVYVTIPYLTGIIQSLHFSLECYPFHPKIEVKLGQQAAPNVRNFHTNQAELSFLSNILV